MGAIVTKALYLVNSAVLRQHSTTALASAENTSDDVTLAAAILRPTRKTIVSLKHTSRAFHETLRRDSSTAIRHRTSGPQCPTREASQFRIWRALLSCLASAGLDDGHRADRSKTQNLRAVDANAGYQLPPRPCLLGCALAGGAMLQSMPG